MQVPFATEGLSFQDYIDQKLHKKARLERCPACGSRPRHKGYYWRKFPLSFQVARFYCRKCQMTISLLPEFANARLPGLLRETETAVRDLEQGKSSAEACPSRISTHQRRWLGRRQHLVTRFLTAVIGLDPGRFQGCKPTLSSFAEALGGGWVLETLRRTVGTLDQLLVPVGFRAARTGPDPP